MNNQKESVSATSKYLRISASKLSPILSKVRGKTYQEALEILKFLPQKGGSFVWQTLYSAVSNAINNFDFQKENLMIQEAYVNPGPMLKRMRPRARGRAFAIQKKNVSSYCHSGRKRKLIYIHLLRGKKSGSKNTSKSFSIS